VKCDFFFVLLQRQFNALKNMSVLTFGVIAAVILLASFVLRGEKKIRMANMVGCVFLVLFAIKMHAEEINTARVILVLLGVATVFVHVVHFWHDWKESRAKKEVARAEERAAKAEAKVDEQLGINEIEK
jgi:uncharacterized membrane protein